MAESPRFTVPKRNIPALQAFAKLDQVEFASLVEAIENGHPVSSVAALQAIIMDHGSMEESSARRIVIALVGLYNLHTLHSWDLRAVIEIASESPELELDPGSVAQLRERLTRVLDLTDVQLISKAIDVAGQHANGLHTTRIITDIRPVFPEAEADSIDAAIVSQTLILRYFDDSGIERTFFVKASEEQLRDLQTQILRAGEKAMAVDRLFKSANVRMIQEEG